MRKRRDTRITCIYRGISDAERLRQRIEELARLLAAMEELRNHMERIDDSTRRRP